MIFNNKKIGDAFKTKCFKPSYKIANSN